MLSFWQILPAAIFAAGIPGFAVAETIKAAPEQPLQGVLDRARDGDAQPGVVESLHIGAA